MGCGVFEACDKRLWGEAKTKNPRKIVEPKKNCFAIENPRKSGKIQIWGSGGGVLGGISTMFVFFVISFFFGSGWYWVVSNGIGCC